MSVPAGKLFYRIGEVAKAAGVEVYVLRYWESEFRQLSPRKNRGGQRVYTQRELDLVLRIKRMLHDEGYTISGARKRLTEESGAGKKGRGAREAGEGAADAVSRHSRESGNPVSFSSDDKKLADALGNLKDELVDILKIIKQD